MIKIKNLGNTPFEVIHRAFIDAFSDYQEPLQLSLEQLKNMVERRGCNLELSFGAFNNTQLVGFTLNGIDQWKKQLAAYDTGTGIIKDFQGNGIAKKIFQDSLPILKANNINQYLLEVLQTNTKAFQLYQKLGFDISNTFDYYIFSKEQLRNENRSTKQNFDIKEISNLDWKKLESFWDFNPSWQNSTSALLRKIDSFSILGVFEQGSIIGYGIIEKLSGDIPQLAIHPAYRRQGFGTALMQTLADFAKGEQLKMINVKSDDKPFKQFTKSLQLKPGGGQFEMTLQL
ncbi:GNAT family N-acetyltransferase [Xanthovirga aplysinae]|uniref:GNAT family N-acetyltransferase n=1 Tax=Xanthovirga aplysinae TaxID=2529853 RepID=UPI0012BD2248|nr:GNAT family N-acetyltransferase [Xanthovirga aplysinae]MTI30855.1 GNAT family N-acetyltransferase [Xanthovirga aplysinae]